MIIQQLGRHSFRSGIQALPEAMHSSQGSVGHHRHHLTEETLEQIADKLDQLIDTTASASASNI